MVRTVDWNHVGYRVWQCLAVLAVVVTVGCLFGMLGAAPTP
jgi:hypothetical protein